VGCAGATVADPAHWAGAKGPSPRWLHVLIAFCGLHTPFHRMMGSPTPEGLRKHAGARTWPASRRFPHRHPRWREFFDE
jgi:hypothetical protein